MTAVGDGIRLINQESAAFAFLPAINYLYIYSHTADPGMKINGIVIISLLISAVGFNILSQVSFERYLNQESGQKSVIGLWNLTFLLTITVVWCGVLINSLIHLWPMTGRGTIWPELLIASTLLVIFLAITDILLEGFLSIYQ